MIVRRSMTATLDAVALGLLRGEQRPLHERAPGEDHDVAAVPRDAPPCRTASCSRGRDTAPLLYGLAVQVLVLEEQHRVVAADRRAQQPGRVLRVRRERDADARRVREDRDARLAVIRRAAAQVAADRHADHHRTRPVVARPVAHHRHLVANLHEGRPDVVEELDLDDRLQPAQRHADAAADDVRFGQRRVEDAVAAELPLQAVGDLEHAALAGDGGERLLAAGVGHVLAEDDDARIARHLVAQRGVDGVHHRVRRARRLRLGRKRR